MFILTFFDDSGCPSPVCTSCSPRDTHGGGSHRSPAMKHCTTKGKIIHGCGCTPCLDSSTAIALSLSIFCGGLIGTCGENRNRSSEEFLNLETNSIPIAALPRGADIDVPDVNLAVITALPLTSNVPHPEGFADNACCMRTI